MNDQQKTTCPLNVGGQSPQQPYIAEDEITLTQMVTDIWNERWLIIAVTIIVVIVTAVVLSRSPETYHVIAEIERPGVADVLLPLKPDFLQINQNSQNAAVYFPESLQPQYLFDRFYQLARSRDIWMSFSLGEQWFADASEDSIKEYSSKYKRLRFKALAPKEKEDQGVKDSLVLRIVFQGSTKDDLSRVLRDYLDFVGQKVVAESLSGLLKQEITEVERKLIRMSKDDEAVLLTKISDLQKSYLEAEQLGMDEYHLVVGKGTLSDTQAINIVNVNSYTDKYLRGTKLLGIEIDMLKKQIGKGTFRSNPIEFAILRSYLTELVAFKTDLPALHSYRYLSRPLDVAEKINSKSRLILLMNAVLGMMAGVAVSLIKAYILRKKEEKL